MRIRRVLAGAGIALAALLVLAAPVAAQEGEGEDEELTHEAEECIHVLEDGGDPEDCHEAPSPILPEANEIIWGAISFAVLFALLYKLAWPGLKSGMEARTQRIRADIDAAEHAKSDAEQILGEYRSQLADARSEAARVIEEARQQADALRHDLQSRAETEIAELRQRAAADVEAAKSQAIADLRDEVARIAIGAAEAVIQRSLDRDTQLRLIEDYINQVAAARNV